MPSIIIELNDGRLDPIELQTPPKKTAAKVLDACTRKFGRGVGSLSPKDKPNLLLEDNDVVAGGVTYVFTPIAGSQGTAAGQRAFSVHVASSDEDIDAVDAETDETPVRSFKVSRSHQGKLFLDGIEKALANRGLVLLGIGKDGFPAHKDGWTMTTYNTSPVQLIVAPKPVEDERFKDRDLMMKCLMLLVTVCTAIVGIALYIKWRRPSGIPSSG